MPCSRSPQSIPADIKNRTRGGTKVKSDQGKDRGTREPGGTGGMMVHGGHEGVWSQWVGGPKWSPGLSGWRRRRGILMPRRS